MGTFYLPPGLQMTGIPSEITSYLYLGDMKCVTQSKLGRYGITHVLSCTAEFVPPRMHSVQLLQLKAYDFPNYSIARHFDEGTDFINKARKSGGKVLVHCAMGISRSTSLCIAYFMRYEGIKLKTAYELIKAKRPIVRPNFGFMTQLIAYEKRLFGSTSVQMINYPGVGFVPDIYVADGTLNFAGPPGYNPSKPIIRPSASRTILSNHSLKPVGIGSTYTSNGTSRVTPVSRPIMAPAGSSLTQNTTSKPVGSVYGKTSQQNRSSFDWFRHC